MLRGSGKRAWRWPCRQFQALANNNYLNLKLERFLFTKSVDQKVRLGQLSSLCPWERKEAPMDRQPASDFPLLTRACQGDRRAMEILIEFCGTRMRRTIRKLCRKSAHLDVDDILQDTWVLLLKGNRRVLGKYQASMGDLGAYLFGILHKVVCKNQHQQRLQSKREVLLPGSPSKQAHCFD